MPQQLIRTALDLELQEGTVIADHVFLAGLHRAERTIANRLTRLVNGTLPWHWIDPDKALPWVEKHIGLALAESQVAAVRVALMSKVTVMTGGPGVGKSHHRQSHPAHPRRKGHRDPIVCADRPRCQAHD